MKIRYAKKNEKNIAIRFWRDSFTDNEAQINFYFDNIYNDKNYLVLEENKKIVSSLHENDYILNINSQSIDTKYIVGVSSDLTQRNKGYMSKLIEYSLKNSKKKNMPFVFLTPINPEIYRKFGFEYFSNIEYYNFSIDNLAKFKFPKENYDFIEVEKNNRKIYFKDLQKIYNFNMKKNFCFLERNDFYFEKLLKECEADEMKTFILYKENLPSAYIIFSLSDEHIDIRECFAMDATSYKEILALIYGYKDYYSNVTLASPQASNIDFIFSNQLNIEKKIKPFMMMRILDPLAIFRILNLEKTDLKIYVVDNLLEENTGIYDLKNDISFIKISQNDSKLSYDFKLNINDLVPLVCGYLTFDELLFLNKIETKTKRDLSHFFTKKNSYLYEFI